MTRILKTDVDQISNGLVAVWACPLLFFPSNCVTSGGKVELALFRIILSDSRPVTPAIIRLASTVSGANALYICISDKPQP